MDKHEYQDRTKAFAVAVVHFCRSLPRTREGDLLARQLLRAGTSVAANYRAACRARSRAEFIAKLGIVEEEADEAMFWLDMLQTIGAAEAAVAPLVREADQLRAMTVASIRTSRRRAKP